MRRSGGPAVLAVLAAGCGGADGPTGIDPSPAPAAGVEARPAFPTPGATRPFRPRPFPADPPGAARAREEMVERDLRAIGVTDTRVLEAMRVVPRHLFVPPRFVPSAYEDTPLPIGHGQTISAPDVVGYMTQALRVEEGAKVLDVGTGSGYQAAVLAEMGCRVLSIEILEPLATEAKARLERLSYASVSVRAGDGYLGWPEEAPFDGILVAAAPDHVPKPLVDQLRPGARLVLPVGPEGEVQRLLVLTRREDGTVEELETLSVRFVPMTRK